MSRPAKQVPEMTAYVTQQLARVFEDGSPGTRRTGTC
jgi:hypothetical protein